MIQRIRKGNDFKHIWPITWNGQPEDFSDATDITLTATVYGKVKTLTKGVDYHIDGGNVVVDFTPAICDITGTYTVELNYIKPSAEFIDGDRRSAVDVQAFQIVNTSAEANATEGVSLPSEALAIYALKYEDLSHENIAELQRPATEAAESIGELEQTIEGNEAIRQSNESDRQIAEGLRQTNTLTAIQNANTAADNANEMSSHPPVIIDDYWHNWNFTTNQYETTGQYARGDSAIEGSLVSQTTGQSAVDVMSQKAVTDEIAQLAGDVEQLAYNVDESRHYELSASGIIVNIPNTNIVKHLINTDLSDSDIWGSGYLIDDIIAESDNYVYTKNFIPIAPIKYNDIHLESDFNAGLVLYDKDYNFVEHFSPSTLNENGLNVPSNARYFRFSHKLSLNLEDVYIKSNTRYLKASNRVFATTEDLDSNATISKQDIYSISKILSQLGVRHNVPNENIILNYKDSDVNDVDLWREGYIDNTGAIISTTALVYSKHIPVNPISYRINIMGQGMAGVSLYDVDKEFIKNIPYDEISNISNEFPENTRYLIFGHVKSQPTNNLNISSSQFYVDENFESLNINSYEEDNLKLNNIIVNGDFRFGKRHWRTEGYHTGFTVDDDGIASATFNDHKTRSFVYPVEMVSGHLYYYVVKARTNNYTLLENFEVVQGVELTDPRDEYIFHPGWNIVKGVIESNGSNNIRLNFNNTEEGRLYNVGKLDYFMLFDLTESFGVTSTTPKREVDGLTKMIKGYIEGKYIFTAKDVVGLPIIKDNLNSAGIYEVIDFAEKYRNTSKEDTDLWGIGFIHLGNNAKIHPGDGSSYYSKNYINIEGIEELDVDLKVGSTSGIAFYDKDLNYISGLVPPIESGVSLIGKFAPPVGAKYMRFAQRIGLYPDHHFYIKTSVPKMVSSGDVFVEKDFFSYSFRKEMQKYEIDRNKNHFNRSNPPIISFIADDCSIHNDWWLDLLEEYGVRGTFAATIGFIDKPQYYDKSQIVDIVLRGHELANHCLTHPRLGDIPDEDIDREINLSKLKLMQLDARVDINFLVSPHGSRDARVDKIALQNHLGNFVASFSLTNSSGEPIINTPPITPHRIKRLGIDNDNDGNSRHEQTMQAVDMLDDTPGWLVFMIHPQMPEYISGSQQGKAEMRTLIEYIISKDIPILTVSQAWKYYHNLVDIEYLTSSDKRYALGKDGSEHGEYFDDEQDKHRALIL